MSVSVYWYHFRLFYRKLLAYFRSYKGVSEEERQGHYFLGVKVEKMSLLPTSWFYTVDFLPLPLNILHLRIRVESKRRVVDGKYPKKAQDISLRKYGNILLWEKKTKKQKEDRVKSKDIEGLGPTWLPIKYKEVEESLQLCVFFSVSFMSQLPYLLILCYFSCLRSFSMFWMFFLF